MVAGSAGIDVAPTHGFRFARRSHLFDALGAMRWGERARQELRATGEKLGPRTPDARDRLTAQELQIAELAAAGLTNREIGERMFLSHRTIGSHLTDLPEARYQLARNCGTSLAAVREDAERARLTEEKLALEGHDS